MYLYIDVYTYVNMYAYAYAWWLPILYTMAHIEKLTLSASICPDLIEPFVLPGSLQAPCWLVPVKISYHNIDIRQMTWFWDDGNLV